VADLGLIDRTVREPDERRPDLDGTLARKRIQRGLARATSAN